MEETQRRPSRTLTIAIVELTLTTAYIHLTLGAALASLGLGRGSGPIRAP